MTKPPPRRASSSRDALDRYGPVSSLIVGAVLAILAAWVFMAGPSQAWAAAQTWPSHVGQWAAGLDEKVQGGRCGLGTCSVKTQADDALAGLGVAAESHATTYRRAKFGEAWTDVDHNHCDTRDDMLRRDLQDEVTRRTSTCSIGAPVTGRFVDPYSGAEVTFNKARAIDVQIDHVASLAEAWRSGAYAWTDAQRLAYANDPDVLVTTTRQINEAKSDHDAAEAWRECVKRGPSGRCTGWQDDRPTGARACTYAARVIAIKKKYALDVDPAEREALGSLLGNCS